LPLSENRVAPTQFKFEQQDKCHLKLSGQNWPLGIRSHLEKSWIVYYFWIFLDNSDNKAHTVKGRNNPFDECEMWKFKIRFRLLKSSTVKKLLE